MPADTVARVQFLRRPDIASGCASLIKEGTNRQAMNGKSTKPLDQVRWRAGRQVRKNGREHDRTQGSRGRLPRPRCHTPVVQAAAIFHAMPVGANQSSMLGRSEPIHPGQAAPILMSQAQVTRFRRRPDSVAPWLGVAVSATASCFPRGVTACSAAGHPSQLSCKQAHPVLAKAHATAPHALNLRASSLRRHPARAPIRKTT